MKSLFSTIVLAFFISSTIAQTTDYSNLKGKKILIVFGGWKGHKPDLQAQKFKELLTSAGAEVQLCDSLGVYQNEALMSSLDLIVQSWTMDVITPNQMKGLAKAVKSGVGIAGCHGGLGDSFRNNTEYQYMIGGQFVSHPGGQKEYKVVISNKKDTETKGIKDFTLNTEQYYMHIDPNVNVLATTTFDGKQDEWITGATMPVAWKKHFGKGRVFYLSIGHNVEDYSSPDALKLLMNGFQWAAQSKTAKQEAWLSPKY